MSDERRRDPRFKKETHIIIHSPYYESRMNTVDLSLGGVCICNGQRYYDINSALYLEIVMSEPGDDSFSGDGSIFCNAEVVSIYPHTKDAATYKITLQFLDMSESDKEKLKKYLAEDTDV